jgi:hypothetical protein
LIVGIVSRKRHRESPEKRAAHVDTPQSLQLAVVPGDRLGEGTVDIQSDDAHAPSAFVRSKWELADDTTSTDPRSRRIRESRKGRPCNELGLSAQRLWTACPHLRAPGAPCPGWAHHIAVSPSRNRRTARRRRISYRVTVRPSGRTARPRTLGSRPTVTRTWKSQSPCHHLRHRL